MSRIKGRATCCVVEAECEAPAGLMVSRGVTSLPGKTGLHVCDYCGEAVCGPCSKQVDTRRVCRIHSDEEVQS